jgi:hypothetical protein
LILIHSLNQTKKKDKGDYVLDLTVSPHRFYHRGVRLSRLAAIKGFLMMEQRYKLNKNEPNKIRFVFSFDLKCMLLPFQLANDIAHGPKEINWQGGIK